MSLEEKVLQCAQMSFEIFIQHRYGNINPAHEEATKELLEQIQAADKDGLWQSLGQATLRKLIAEELQQHPPGSVSPHQDLSRQRPATVEQLQKNTAVFTDDADLCIFMQEKLESLSGSRQLTAVEEAVLSVITFDNEVQSGGLESFLLNSSRIFANQIIDHLHTVGATKIANHLNRCKNTMERHGVSFTTVADMNEMPPAACRAMERFDQAYYDISGLDALEYITAEFIRAHLKELPDFQ